MASTQDISETIQEELDELGVDVDFDEIDSEAVSYTSPSTGPTDYERVMVDVFETCHPEKRSKPVNLTRERLAGNTEVVINADVRPECPNCGYTPNGEDEPIHLPGECHICGTSVCPRCKTTCSACGNIMCQDHSDGHGLEEQPYCDTHVTDVYQEHEHRREMERRKQEHTEHMDRMEVEMRREKQRQEMELKRRKQRANKREREFQMRLKMAQQIVQTKNRQQGNGTPNRLRLENSR